MRSPWRRGRYEGQGSVTGDAFHAAHSRGAAPLNVPRALFEDQYCIRVFVPRAAIDIVDGGLTASGSEGDLSERQVGRRYRNVRAG